MTSWRRIHDVLDQTISERPDALAAIDHDGRRLSYGELERVIVAAMALLEECGVRPGDRVMIASENALAPIALIFACSRMDAWAVPVNARLTQSELTHIRDHAEPRAMLFCGASSDAAEAHARTFGARDCGVALLAGVHAIGGLSADPEPVFEQAAEQVGILIYTTGTMGAPKGVMVTHGNSLQNIDANIVIRGMSAEDCVFSAPPHTHIFGLTACLAGFAAGASVLFHPRFDPETAFASIAEGVSVMPAVPAMYARLLEYAARHGISKPDAPQLRYISAGGAPLDPDWKRRVEAFFGLTLHNGYGLTEAAPIVSATRHDEARNDVTTGRAAPNVEIKLRPLPGGDEGTGEVLCRGPNVMKGYYKNPEATAAVIDADGFLHTGDLGRLCSDGSLTIIGRTKEVILRSGFNVYPTEVEAVLNQHADVRQAAVVGRAAGDGNEDVLAFIERAEGAAVTEDVLRAYTRVHLSAYKQPTHFVIVDKLPAAPTGKVLRGRLVEHYADQLPD